MNNILFISAFPPNSKTAGQNYTQLLLNDLIQHDYKIDLIYFDYPNHDIQVNENVKVLKSFNPTFKNILKSPFTYPLFTKRFNKKILNYINSIATKYDIIYFDFSQVHIYSKYINHPCKILMCHDVIYQKTKRQLPILIWWEKLTEKSILKSVTKIITFSKKDSDLIKKIYGFNSIPVNFYLKNDLPEKLPEIEKNTFCFYGAWNRKENVETLDWFIKKVLPNISFNFKFKIIGSGMDDKLRNKLSNFKSIEYVGFVDDPVMEIAKCQALIAPLFHGAGVKVKVIDALTSGTKVIGTDIAFEGIIDNEKNPMFIRCHESKGFVSVLNNWLEDSRENKLDAAKEFFLRYDKNHLPMLLEQIDKEPAQ